MKYNLNKLLLAIVGLLLSTTALAHDFEVDGVYYRYLDESAKTVAVTTGGYSNGYSGSITIPSSVTYNGTTYSVASIDKSAFQSCTRLTSITIPNSVTEIGEYAFSGCSRLTSITIPNSVTKIDNSAFSGCSGLTSITIPNSVTEIGKYAFYNTGWDNNQAVGVVYINNVLYQYKGTMPKGTSILIKDGTVSISPGAFDGYTGLTEVTIGNSVTEIGEKAFSGCKGLTEVTIPNSVTKIDNSAFSDCLGLTEVTIGNSVTEIGRYAFYGCKGLKSVTIPNSVTEIGYGAFSECTSLTEVTIPNSVTKIDNSAFSDCLGLTEVTIGNSVTKIDNSAFSGCSGLTEVTIGNSVTEIGYGAFYGCKGLKSVTIPNSVTKIGEKAFSGCPNISSLTIGSGVSYISPYAFSDVKPKKTIWLTNTPPSGYEYAAGVVNYVANNEYSSLSNVKVYPYLSSIFEVDGVKYVPVNPSERTCDALDCSYDSAIDSVHIGKTVSYKGIAMNIKNVNHYTFYKNSYLYKITIDDEFIGSFGDFAFAECSNIDEIEIPNMVQSIGSNCFEGCENLGYAIIGTSIPAINDNTFNRCSSLTEIEIPENVESVGDFAFKGCSNLSEVIIKDRITVLSLGSNKSKPLFSDCPLDSVYIGGDISYKKTSDYGYSPFYNNKTLRAVTISNKETEISENEFYGCANLKSVSIGDGIMSIGNYAFSGCSSLKSFAFGSNLTTIGEEAFSDCSSLVKLSSNAINPPVCGQQALDDINKWECELYVPDNAVSAYKDANQWKDFFFINPNK